MKERAAISKTRRDRLVLQMFDPKAEELKNRADSFLSITPKQRLALIAAEFEDLYREEMAKDERYMEALAEYKALSDAERTPERMQEVLMLPRTDKKLAVLYLTKHEDAVKSILSADIQRENIRARTGTSGLEKPTTAATFAKTRADIGWKPGPQA